MGITYKKFSGPPLLYTNMGLDQPGQVLKKNRVWVKSDYLTWDDTCGSVSISWGFGNMEMGPTSTNSCSPQKLKDSFVDLIEFTWFHQAEKTCVAHVSNKHVQNQQNTIPSDYARSLEISSFPICSLGLEYLPTLAKIYGTSSATQQQNV